MSAPPTVSGSQWVGSPLGHFNTLCGLAELFNLCIYWSFLWRSQWFINDAYYYCLIADICISTHQQRGGDGCALLCITAAHLIGAKRKYSIGFLATITKTISMLPADYIQ